MQSRKQNATSDDFTPKLKCRLLLGCASGYRPSAAILLFRHIQVKQSFQHWSKKIPPDLMMASDSVGATE
jgi:hypothetical protein